MESEGFYKIKVKYNPINTGDAGGMKDGFDMISEDSEYIMQLDNDLQITTDNFLEKLVGVMDKNNDVGGIMLTRDGVGQHVNLTNKCIEVNGIKLCEPVRRYSIFYRVNLLKKLNHWVYNEKIGWVFSISEKIHKLGYKIYKTPDIRVLHIDGHPTVVKHNNSEQKHRYPNYFKNMIKKSNYKKINYKND